MERRFSLHRRYPVSGPGLPSDHSAEEDDFCSCEDDVDVSGKIFHVFPRIKPFIISVR